MKARELFEANTIINEWLEESMGEITPEIEEILKTQEEDIEGFIGYMFKLITEQEGLVRAKKDYAKEILESAKTIENRIDRNKCLVDRFMNIIGKDKLQTVAGTVSYRKSEQVKISDSSLIDKKFLVEKIEVTEDKKAIKEAIKNGELVLGAYLEEKRNLQMKG